MLIIHHATREQVWLLMEVFGKLSFEDGEKHVTIPHWLKVMWDTCQ